MENKMGISWNGEDRELLCVCTAAVYMRTKSMMKKKVLRVWSNSGGGSSKSMCGSKEYYRSYEYMCDGASAL